MTCQFLVPGAIRSINLDTLPEPDTYGLCIFRGWDFAGRYSKAPTLVEYDDDDIVCGCDSGSCQLFENLSEEQFSAWLSDEDYEGVGLHTICDCGQLDCKSLNSGHNKHWPISVHIVNNEDGMYECDEYRPLAALPSNWIKPDTRPWLLDSRFEGWIYAVATVPELSLHRLKVGWTTKPIEQRLKSYRTSSPTCLLLGLWEGFPAGEDAAHAACGEPLAGSNEVFDVLDPWKTLDAIGVAVRASNEQVLALKETLKSKRGR